MVEVLRVALWILLAAVGFSIGYFLFVCACCLFVRKDGRYDKNNKFYRALLNGLTVLVLAVLRVRVETEGLEKIPKGRRVLLVSNHRSNYDPIVTWRVLKDLELAFISKPSNFKIPFFGRLVRRCCFMEIDRENAKNAAKTVERASELIASGECSVGVYPEGTRNKRDGLLPFHNSVFKIAQRAKAPIVVCAVCGTERIAKRTPWRRTRVKVKVLEVIESEEACALRTAEIGERVRKEISIAINEVNE